jgi:hypothetical protein
MIGLQSVHDPGENARPELSRVAAAYELSLRLRPVTSDHASPI